MGPVIDADQRFWTFGICQTSWMAMPPYAGDPMFEPIGRSFGLPMYSASSDSARSGSGLRVRLRESVPNRSGRGSGGMIQG
jgi:hypothetical protein